MGGGGFLHLGIHAHGLETHPRMLVANAGGGVHCVVVRRSCQWANTRMAAARTRASLASSVSINSEALTTSTASCSHKASIWAVSFSPWRASHCLRSGKMPCPRSCRTRRDWPGRRRLESTGGPSGLRCFSPSNRAPSSWAALEGHAPNTPVHLVAARITEVDFPVLNNGVRPIGNVERAVRPCFTSIGRKLALLLRMKSPRCSAA